MNRRFTLRVRLSHSVPWTKSGWLGQTETPDRGFSATRRLQPVSGFVALRIRSGKLLKRWYFSDSWR